MQGGALLQFIYVSLELLTPWLFVTLCDPLELIMGERWDWFTINGGLPLWKRSFMAKDFRPSLTSDHGLHMVSANMDLVQKFTQGLHLITKVVREPHICSCLLDCTHLIS